MRGSEDIDRSEMRALARGWGRVADAYVEHLFDELDHKPFDRDLLERFAQQVRPGSVVGDVGCGPGHVSKHLAALGLRMQGVDLCPEMIERARALVPEAEFREGDMLDLDLPDRCWGGCIALYSLINVVRDDAPNALSELARVLAPGSPLLVSVHRGTGTAREEEVLGASLPMAATLYEPDELGALVADAGFTDVDVRVRQPYESEHPTERVYVLAQRGR